VGLCRDTHSQFENLGSMGSRLRGDGQMKHPA
jgi:hypothetical protein